MTGVELSNRLDKTAPKIYIGKVPTRVKPALAIEHQSTFDVCAYFRDEDAAKRFLDAFRAVTGMPRRAVEQNDIR